VQQAFFTETIDFQPDALAPRHPGRIDQMKTTAGIAINRGDVMMDLRVQLKVCEGCGCLWYRSQNQRRVYCNGCDTRLKQFPPVQSRRRPGPKTAITLARILAVACHYQENKLLIPIGAAGGGE
jgi:hypothetical protein